MKNPPLLHKTDAETRTCGCPIKSHEVPSPSVQNALEKLGAYREASAERFAELEAAAYVEAVRALDYHERLDFIEAETRARPDYSGRMGLSDDEWERYVKSCR